MGFGIPGAGAHFSDPSRTLTFDKPMAFGQDSIGVDVTWYGTTSGIYLLWDESANCLKGVGKMDLLFAGSVASWGWDASLNKLYTTGKIDVVLTGSGGAGFTWDGSAKSLTSTGKTDLLLNGSSADLGWDASANKLYTTGKADLVLTGSGSTGWTWDGSAKSLSSTGKTDFILTGSGGAGWTWDASAKSLTSTGKADLDLNGSASSIVWDASANLLTLTAAQLKSLDATTVELVPWGMAFTKTGADFWLKINATSLTTASYQYIKLTSTSVIS